MKKTIPKEKNDVSKSTQKRKIFEAEKKWEKNVELLKIHIEFWVLKASDLTFFWWLAIKLKIKGTLEVKYWINRH
ncbi:CLUMA_CG018600, isoform A [Clunio marinus]|uniref:CLUMA_CG018600, isoform A n=1 Tax=Clunio marinus TaxID=568069 RepID=A0A1J1J2G1_9DIPT|nr:CLUMA_CG018600, isoform A [Clunio marinus]